MILQLLFRLIHMVRNPQKYRRGSPLVEESILLGLSLFAFMILATIVFDLVDFARNIFEQVGKGLDNFP